MPFAWAVLMPPVMPPFSVAEGRPDGSAVDGAISLLMWGRSVEDGARGDETKEEESSAARRRRKGAVEARVFDAGRRGRWWSNRGGRDEVLGDVSFLALQG
jgi:hypothetical protein